MTIARPFSDSYLLAYSGEHVFYEVDMFFGLAAVLSQSSAVVAPRVNNALIEAFVIHLRNIVDFLYIDQPQPTDVVASDFYATGAWQAMRPVISKVLEEVRVRANKELAHLTTVRLSGNVPAKGWAFALLADEIRPLLQLFAAQARSTALSPRVAQALDGG